MSVAGLLSRRSALIERGEIIFCERMRFQAGPERQAINEEIILIGWEVRELEKEARMVQRSEFLAALRMLVKRATWLDRWRARRIPGHWLNVARREIAIG